MTKKFLESALCFLDSQTKFSSTKWGVPSASSSFDQSYAAFVSWFGTGLILIWLKPSESARNWIFIGLNYFLLAICLYSSIILHACIFRLRMRRQHTRLSSSLKEVIQVLLVMFLVSSMSGGRWHNISGVIRVFIERNNFKSFLLLNFLFVFMLFPVKFSFQDKQSVYNECSAM